MQRTLLAAWLLLAFTAAAAAQPQIQRGTVKKFDATKGLITITADDKDLDLHLVPETNARDAANQVITGFKEQGLPIGTAVMFIAQQRGDQQVLVAIRPAGQSGGPRFGGNPPPPAPPPRDTIGVKPLTELGEGKYKGESGGLYGDGQNEPPPAHQEAATKAAAKIQPLDAQGQPSADGKIALLAIGMSNTTQEFSRFKTLADRDPQKSPQVVIVDGAQGGRASEQWIDPKSEVGANTWATADDRLTAAGVTPAQVQVVWIKQAIIAQGRLGEFPAHARKLEQDLVKILQLSQKHFPNLRLAYLSSRIYAGYATTPLNPEPYAHEGAYSVRWVIQSQIKGDAPLNYDPRRGEVAAPVVLWGPYLWGDGVTPRADGLVWKREDLGGDGTHPSDSGRQKVADLLLNFFRSDPYARGWYLKTTAK